MSDMEFILYEKIDDIGVITLNRPETRNAQHPPFLEELDQAWRMGEQDHGVKVIVLKANGPHFSSGHDIGSAEAKEYRKGQGLRPGSEGRYWWESEFYLGLSRRWRDVPKPSIAAVHGKTIAGGLMLCWPCDLIVASEDAQFSDPVVRMGIGGVEYFAHPWEFGARKAKELLFTGQYIGAAEAERIGMVNRVVPRDKLEEETMSLARQIAEMPPFALAMAKRAVNQTLDVQGQFTAMQSVFDMHQLAHAHSELVSGSANMGMSVDKMRAADAAASAKAR